MSLSTLHTCFDGYSDRILDEQILAVHTGYWAGYYAMSKRPESTENVITRMIDAKGKKSKKTAPDVDVDSFIMQEARFAERLGKQGGVSDGRTE